jgi:Putative peptidoglycan binding domain
MNEELEFEASTLQQLLSETEEERASGARRRMPGRGVTSGRRLGTFKRANLRQPVMRPKPRPRIRIPPRLPLTSAAYDTDGIRECNEQIRWVQDSMNRILSLNLPVDGVMSVETRSAVRSFQQRQGLPVTGIVGPDTQQALLAATRSRGAYRGAPSNAGPATDPEPPNDAGPVTDPDPPNDAGGDSDGQSQAAGESFEFFSGSNPRSPAQSPSGPRPAQSPRQSVLLRNVVARGRTVLQQQQRIGYALHPEATRRLQCLLRMILEPRTDDRYINGLSFDFQTVNQRLSAAQFAVLISHVRADLSRGDFAPGRSDRQILIGLELLDRRIFYGVAFLNRHVATSGAASEPGKVQMKDWMAARQRDRNSVYSCYGGVRS